MNKRYLTIAIAPAIVAGALLVGHQHEKQTSTTPIESSQTTQTLKAVGEPEAEATLVPTPINDPTPEPQDQPKKSEPSDTPLPTPVKHEVTVDRPISNKPDPVDSSTTTITSDTDETVTR